jgi:hypothetical protein
MQGPGEGTSPLARAGRPFLHPNKPGATQITPREYPEKMAPAGCHRIHGIHYTGSDQPRQLSRMGSSLLARSPHQAHGPSKRIPDRKVQGQGLGSSRGDSVALPRAWTTWVVPRGPHHYRVLRGRARVQEKDPPPAHTHTHTPRPGGSDSAFCQRLTGSVGFAICRSMLHD